MFKPIYHFTPGKNWMNDPNGVCWYQGYFHLFYQYNPYGDLWGNIHWGHAVSKDCINWKILPAALSPSTEKGEVHCFSGCVSTDEDLLILYYTSVGEEKDGRDSRYGAEQWCAFSRDGMRSWEKYKGNPVLTDRVHGGLKVLEWRDPFVWREEDGWYMVLGAEVEKRGAALLYFSPDRLNWEFCRVLLHSDDPGERIFECPNYFRLSDKNVLVVSPDGMPKYWIGTQGEGHEFYPEKSGIIDHSGWDGFYAPNSFQDDQGRRIMIGWLTEKGRGSLASQGWSGVQSLPRTITLEKGGLCMMPIKEVETLRGSGGCFRDLSVTGVWESPLRGKAAEIILEAERSRIGDRLEIEVFADDRGTEKTVIQYENGTDKVSIDRERSNRSGLADKRTLSCQDTHCTDGRLKLRIFLDHSVLEVFINGREVISTRVYPEGENSDAIRIKAENALIDNLEVYLMNAACICDY